VGTRVRILIVAISIPLAVFLFIFGLLGQLKVSVPNDFDRFGSYQLRLSLTLARLNPRAFEKYIDKFQIRIDVKDYPRFTKKKQIYWLYVVVTYRFLIYFVAELIQTTWGIIGYVALLILIIFAT